MFIIFPKFSTNYLLYYCLLLIQITVLLLLLFKESFKQTINPYTLYLMRETH